MEPIDFTVNQLTDLLKQLNLTSMSENKMELLVARLAARLDAALSREKWLTMLKKYATENAEGLSNVNETLSEVPEDQVSPPQNDSKFLMREDKNVLAEKETGKQIINSVFTGEEEIADEETIPKPTVCVHKYGSKRFLCTKCGEKSYTNKGSLKRHLLVECGKASEYVCPVCGKAFHRKANYQRHAHVVHDIDGSKVGTGSKALYLCMR